MISKEDKRYIHRRKYETMLIGTLPFADQESFFSSLSQRTAMILAGSEGSGKRTLEKAFFDEYSELFPETLYFSFGEYADEGEEKLTAEINSFFDKLSGIDTAQKEEPAKPQEAPAADEPAPAEDETAADAPEGEAAMEEIYSSSPEIEEAAAEEDEGAGNAYLISLGDISRVSEMPGAARALAKRMKELLDNEECMCIVTAVFDGEVRSIPSGLRRLSRICRVDPPSRDERLQFFSAMIEPLAGYVNDTAGVDFMADNTENVSFSELEEIEKALHIYLKAKFVADVAETSGTELTEVEMTDIGIDKVVLEPEDFLYIADSYREKAQPAGSVDMSGIAELVEQLSRQAPEKTEEEKPPSPFALIDDDDDPDFI